MLHDPFGYELLFRPQIGGRHWHAKIRASISAGDHSKGPLRRESGRPFALDLATEAGWS